jgi:hypothetical protein
MIRILLTALTLISFNISQSQSDLTDYNISVSFSKIYEVDLDTNVWDLLAYKRTDVIIELDGSGAGRIFLYFNGKKVFYVRNNYVVDRVNGTRTFFFRLLNGHLLRLGVDENNKISAFSIVNDNNTTITFCN